MAEKEEFRDLLDEVAAGSPEASARFLERFGPGVLQAVRRRLPRRLRPQFDSLDFVQDVWASFFTSDEKREFAEADDLVAFLTKVAQNKVVDAVRARMQAQKRNVNRERRIPDGSTAAAAIPQLADTETPSQAVMSDEEWQKVLQSQPPVYRKVLVMLREGKSVPMVADAVGLSVKTVCRVIERISNRLSLVKHEW